MQGRIVDRVFSQGAPPVDTPLRSMIRRMLRVMPVIPFVLCVLPFLFLVVPLAALLWRALSWKQLTAALTSTTVIQALTLSFSTSLLSLMAVLVIGTPVAYFLARHDFPGRRVLDTILDLPMVLPPAVAGLALLMAFGRRGVLGPLLSSLGLEIAFTTAAVVFAQCFVAAPFYIRAARAGFEEVDPSLEQVARTLGESDWSVFCRITVPLALPGLLGGAVMAWARALGEFGATIMFAGNLPGRSQTMPLAVYTAFESDLGAALTLAVILLAVSFTALSLMKARVTRTSRSPRGP